MHATERIRRDLISRHPDTKHMLSNQDTAKVFDWILRFVSREEYSEYTAEAAMTYLAENVIFECEFLDETDEDLFSVESYVSEAAYCAVLYFEMENS